MSYELQTSYGRVAACLRWAGFTGLLLLVTMVFVATGTAAKANSGTILDWLGGLPVVTLAVAVTGMGLFVLAWLFLGRLTWPDRGRAVTSRWLRRTLALWSAPLMFVPPLFSGTCTATWPKERLPHAVAIRTRWGRPAASASTTS